MHIGTRVVRGPDWTHGESDGGEGHLGTVVKLCDQSMCDVIWDNGHRHRCRAGRGDKHDLLVVDTAPTGLEHPGILCDGCDVFGIAGTRWTCKTCRSCHLCSVCYGDAKHDITHDFVRFDTPGCKGLPVSQRHSSIRMHGTGLFPNAKVKKGPDWSSENNKGNAQGKILSVEDHPSGASVRSMVRVEWVGGQSGLNRVGHEGKVDVQYVTEYPGMFYYRDHLGTFTVEETTESKESRSHSKKDGDKKEKKVKKLFLPGDKVSIKIPPGKLQEVQTKANIWNPIMQKLAPRFGKVKSYTDAGHVLVTFAGFFGAIFGDNTLSVCEEALIKVPTFKEGDIVRISTSESEMRQLQDGHGGYTVDTTFAMGKRGRVRKVTEAGDVLVSFGPSAFQFNPACCSPAPGEKEDKIEDLLAETLGNIEIEFGNHVDMETRVNGVPTTDCGLIQKADAMYDAFSRGNFGLFMTVFKLDPRLKLIMHKGYTPMILASATGASELVKMLIREGVDVNGMDADSQTPLLHAIYREQDDTVPLLINSGCDVNLPGKLGITPLHLSAINEKDDYVELLLQKNAEINKKDDAGNTTAHIAIELDYEDVLAVILKCPRFDPRVTNVRNFNVLQFATLKGGTRYVDMIQSKFPELVEEPMIETGFTCLHIAANNNHRDCTKVLIDKGHANVNVRNALGMTPLILACVNLFDDTVAILLNKGADANQSDCSGDTALHFVLRTQYTLANITGTSSRNDTDDEKRLKIACMLLDKGADFDKKNAMGIRALDMTINDTVRIGVIKHRRRMRQAQAEDGPARSSQSQVDSQTSDTSHTSQDNPRTISDNPRTSSDNPQTSSDKQQTSHDVMECSSDKQQTSHDVMECSSDKQQTSHDVMECGSDPAPASANMTLPCSKCMTNMVDVELKPCGHRLVCKNCVSNVEQCPLCKESILGVEDMQSSEQTDKNCKVQ